MGEPPAVEVITAVNSGNHFFNIRDSYSFGLEIELIQASALSGSQNYGGELYEG
jgi:hypothetical protein